MSTTINISPEFGGPQTTIIVSSPGSGGGGGFDGSADAEFATGKSIVIYDSDGFRWKLIAHPDGSPGFEPYV
jgi:hypothetical protein